VVSSCEALGSEGDVLRDVEIVDAGALLMNEAGG